MHSQTTTLLSSHQKHGPAKNLANRVSESIRRFPIRRLSRRTGLALRRRSEKQILSIPPKPKLRRSRKAICIMCSSQMHIFNNEMVICGRNGICRSCADKVSQLSTRPHTNVIQKEAWKLISLKTSFVETMNHFFENGKYSEDPVKNWHNLKETAQRLIQALPPLHRHRLGWRSEVADAVTVGGATMVTVGVVRLEEEKEGSDGDDGGAAMVAATGVVRLEEEKEDSDGDDYDDDGWVVFSFDRPFQ